MPGGRLAVAAGVADFAGLTSYAHGASISVAVCAVLASAFAALVPAAAGLLLGERLRPSQ
jgi:hypothetical protein